MNATKSETNLKRSERLNVLAADYGEAVLNLLLMEFRKNPDAVRNAIDSVGVRNLEIYESYRNQRDAALEEWLHEGGSNG